MRFVVALLFLLLTLPLHAQNIRVTSTVNPDTTDGAIPNITSDTLEEYTPPPIYEKWWHAAMWCSGLTMPMAETKNVKFSFIRAASFTVWGDTTQYVGFTFAWDKRILVIIWDVQDRRIIIHEMIHYLQWWNGTGFGHPTKLFNNDRCSVR